MKKIFNYFRTEEKVRLGGKEIKIEHSALENLVDCGAMVFVATITSPIWVPVGLYYLGKESYNQIKGNYFDKKENEK